MKVTLISIVALAVTIPATARLGETEAELAARYGPALRLKTAEALRTYRHNGLVVRVTLDRGRSVQESVSSGSAKLTLSGAKSIAEAIMGGPVTITQETETWWSVKQAEGAARSGVITCFEEAYTVSCCDTAWSEAQERGRREKGGGQERGF